MKSAHPQYHISHFKPESLIPPKVSMPLLVKASQWKTHRDAAVTQTVTGKIQEQQIEFDDEICDDELADPLHIPEEPTNHKKSQQATKDEPINGHAEETKYLVFWSCLLPLFCYCLKCLAYATIKWSVLKSNMVIITLLCAENFEKYGPHNQI